MSTWLPVPGYHSLYNISDSGVVASYKGVEIKRNILNSGIASVILYDGEKYHNLHVCLLMYEAFRGVEYGSQCVSHINGDNSDDRLENLCLASEKFAETDEWKNVRGYEDLYQVSRNGVVRSKDRLVFLRNGYKFLPSEIKAPMKVSDGYFQVGLYNQTNSYGVMRNIHRLVAECFIPNPDNKPTVNHIDGNKENNCLENLEWATYSEQQEHAVRTGLRLRTYWKPEDYEKSLKIYNDANSIEVRCIETQKVYSSYSEAARDVNLTASEIKSSVDTHIGTHGLHFVKNKDSDYYIGVKDLPGESWKSIPGYEDIYMISNLGRIKTLQRIVKTYKGFRTKDEKLISSSRSTVSLSKDGTNKSFNKHQLMTLLFS